jgi:O-antigen ligase
MLYLLIGYIFLFIHRPFEVWPWLGEMRLELVYMIVMSAVWLVYAGKRFVPNAFNVCLLAFVGVVLAGWMVSPWFSADNLAVMNYLKSLVFYLILVTVVYNEADLRTIVRAFVAVMAIYMLHSLWEFRNGRHEYRMGIERMMGIDQTMNDPNTFGASIVYTLPLVKALWYAQPSRRWHVLLGGFVALAILCIVLTGSRSALVTMLLWAALTLWGTRRRWLFVGLALVAAVLSWFLLPAELQTRFESIVRPEVVSADAQTSAEGRIKGFYIGLDLWRQNPLLGCGPGLWRKATGSPTEAHNLYGQVLGETGTLGALAFAALVISLVVNVRRIRAAYRAHPEWERDFLYHLAGAIGLVVVLLLFEGFFSHNMLRYNWFWYGAFALLALDAVHQRAASPEADAPVVEVAWAEMEG